MLKKIIIIVLILSLGLISGMFLVRNTVNSTINNTIEAINSSIIGSYYNIRIVDSKSDFFQTRITTAFRAKDKQSEPVILVHSAKHFPIAINNSNGVTINLAKIESNLFTSWIQYNGDINIVSPAYGTIKINKNFTKIRSKLDLEALKLQSALEIERGNNNLWYGTALTLLNLDNQQLKLKIFLEDSNPNLSITINSSGMKLPVNLNFNGPFNLNMVIGKINAKNFSELLSRLKDFNNVEQATISLLQNNIKIEVKDTFFTADSGKITLSLNTLVGNGEINNLNENDILKTLQGEVFIKAPKNIITQALQSRAKRELMQELRTYSKEHGGSENPVSYNRSISARNKEILRRSKIKLNKLIKDRILLEHEDLLQLEAEFNNGSVLINGVLQEQF